MEPLSFSSFDKKIYIRSKPEALYRAFASAEGLCSWFLEEAVFKDENGIPRSPSSLASANDRYTWKWHNWDGEESGLVTAADGCRLLEFEFAGSKTRITVGEILDGSVLVHLRQYDIPTDDESKLRIHTDVAMGGPSGWQTSKHGRSTVSC
jgi:hypothetical protein